MIQTVNISTFMAPFDDIPPNTNYSVSVNTETKTQKSDPSHASCQMPPSVPDKEKLNGLSLTRYQKADKWGLRASLPKVSQRKGPICCYSIVVVKMLEGKTISSLPEPHLLPLLTYEKVHQEGAGAYIAEMFDVDRLPSDVSLGDGNRIDTSNPPCRSCSIINGPKPVEIQIEHDRDMLSEDRVERSSSRDAPTNSISSEALSSDGTLLPESNYTLFVRVSIISLIQDYPSTLFLIEYIPTLIVLYSYFRLASMDSLKACTARTPPR